MTAHVTTSRALYLQRMGDGQGGRILRPQGWLRRKARLKAVFEGRCAQLEAVRATPWPHDATAYSRAVGKYQSARRAWRAFRGWK